MHWREAQSARLQRSSGRSSFRIHSVVSAPSAAAASRRGDTVDTSEEAVTVNSQTR